MVGHQRLMSDEAMRRRYAFSQVLQTDRCSRGCPGTAPSTGLTRVSIRERPLGVAAFVRRAGHCRSCLRSSIRFPSRTLIELCWFVGVGFAMRCAFVRKRTSNGGMRWARPDWHPPRRRERHNRLTWTPASAPTPCRESGSGAPRCARRDRALTPCWVRALGFRRLSASAGYIGCAGEML